MEPLHHRKVFLVNFLKVNCKGPMQVSAFVWLISNSIPAVADLMLALIPALLLVNLDSLQYLQGHCPVLLEDHFSCMCSSIGKARWSILRDMPYYHIDTQRDIVLATMAIHNYIRKKCNVDDAFQTAENESYIPLVDYNDIGTTSRANNVDVEDVGEQNDVYWMGFRDMIAIDISNA
ncbi:uncharacterized protein LOC132640898 [Lycium barbarum]|uniref:uncharacterized protein LOC132640898 n=1 Tax=Lycium barbarum TaxID=112863 RepID=UPI00293E95E3|nr:uncharacterized protein LOC132640898 [Lycium barbarum]